MNEGKQMIVVASQENASKTLGVGCVDGENIDFLTIVDGDIVNIVGIHKNDLAKVRDFLNQFLD